MRIFSNPIIIKELFTRLRHKRILLSHTIYYVILMFTLISLYIQLDNRYNYGYESIGKSFFITIILIQLGIISVFASMNSVASIIMERREKTFDLLVITPLTPSDIIAGKAIASILYYMLYLLSGLPFLILAMIAGGFSLIDICVGFIVLCVFILFVSLLGILISTYMNKLIAAIGGLVIILAVYGIFIFGTTMDFIFRLLRYGSNRQIPFVMSFNPVTAIYSFLQGSVETRLFHLKINIMWGYLICIIPFIILFFWAAASILKNAKRNLRTMSPQLFVFSFSTLFTLIVFCIASEYRHSIFIEPFEYILIASVLLVSPFYIDRQSRNIDYNQKGILNRFLNFAQKHQYIFMIMIIVLFGTIFELLIDYIFFKHNIPSNYSKIFVYGYILIVLFSIAYFLLAELCAHIFKTKKVAITVLLLIFSIFIFCTYIQLIVYETNNYRTPPTINLLPVNPFSALVLLNDTNEFGSKFKLLREETLGIGSVSYILFIIILKVILTLYKRRIKKYTVSDLPADKSLT